MSVSALGFSLGYHCILTVRGRETKARRSWEVLGTQSKTGVWLEKCSAVKGPALFGWHHEAP